MLWLRPVNDGPGDTGQCGDIQGVVLPSHGWSPGVLLTTARGTGQLLPSWAWSGTMGVALHISGLTQDCRTPRSGAHL